MAAAPPQFVLRPVASGFVSYRTDGGADVPASPRPQRTTSDSVPPPPPPPELDIASTSAQKPPSLLRSASPPPKPAVPLRPVSPPPPVRHTSGGRLLVTAAGEKVYNKVVHKSAQVDTNLVICRRLVHFFDKVTALQHKFASDVEKEVLHYKQRLRELDALDQKSTMFKAAINLLNSATSMGDSQGEMAHVARQTVVSDLEKFYDQGVLRKKELWDEEKDVTNNMKQQYAKLENTRKECIKKINSVMESREAFLEMEQAEKMRIWNLSTQDLQKSKTNFGKILSKVRPNVEKERKSLVKEKGKVVESCKTYDKLLTKTNQNQFIYFNAKLPSIYERLQVFEEECYTQMNSCLRAYQLLYSRMNKKNMLSITNMERHTSTFSIDSDRHAFETVRCIRQPDPPSLRAKPLVYRLPYTTKELEELNVDAQKSTLFEALHRNSTLCTYFERFCQERYCTESLRFYQQVEVYKTLPQHTRSAKALEMYHTFISSDASLHINLPDAISHQLLSIPDMTSFSRDMFSDAQQDIFNLMKEDVFKSFLDSSNEYTSYLKAVGR